MILGFKTHINGKPTYFREKILSSLWELKEQKIDPEGLEKYKFFCKYPVKINTIREDKNNRWKAGVMIDFYTGVRTKAMKRFGTRVPVVSTQKIEILYYKNFKHIFRSVIVDSHYLSIEEQKELAQNDGFDTLEDFFNYFDKNFTGKIIHWTDKKY